MQGQSGHPVANHFVEFDRMRRDLLGRQLRLGNREEPTLIRRSWLRGDFDGVLEADVCIKVDVNGLYRPHIFIPELARESRMSSQTHRAPTQCQPVQAENLNGTETAHTMI